MRASRRRLVKDVDSTPNWQQRLGTRQRSVTVDKVNELTPNFIYEGWIATEVCDPLLKYYDECNYLQKTSYSDGKHSTDLHLHRMIADSEECLQNYLQHLAVHVERYFELFPYAGFMPCRISELFNIQRYNPGEGYSVWHWERSDVRNTRDRHLVWMTYLSDNPDGGTEWHLQNKYVSAEYGKTVIWPAEWTHTHRGRVCDTEKTIITGWIDLDY